jgi:uncharacterized protein (DUF1330 family)
MRALEANMAIEPDDAQLQRFLENDDKRPFVMVQLLRLGEDGQNKYLRYSFAAQPIVRRFGAEVLYAGSCTEPLLAAQGQAWDGVVIVRYPSRAAYAQFHQSPEYRAIAHLRADALREVMLLPMDDWPGR